MVLVRHRPDLRQHTPLPKESGYRAIRVLVLDSDGDGVPTQVVLLGRKGKKAFRRVLLP